MFKLPYEIADKQSILYINCKISLWANLHLEKVILSYSHKICLPLHVINNLVQSLFYKCQTPPTPLCDSSLLAKRYNKTLNEGSPFAAGVYMRHLWPPKWIGPPTSQILCCYLVINLNLCFPSSPTGIFSNTFCSKQLGTCMGFLLAYLTCIVHVMEQLFSFPMLLDNFDKEMFFKFSKQHYHKFHRRINISHKWHNLRISTRAG